MTWLHRPAGTSTSTSRSSGPWPTGNVASCSTGCSSAMARPSTSLCEALPHLSRFGVMKHLSVLEHAGLVTTRRDGRHKVHFLNPVPIRGIHDRWISKYAAPWIDVLTGIQGDLEGSASSTATHLDAIA